MVSALCKRFPVSLFAWLSKKTNSWEMKRLTNLKESFNSATSFFVKKEAVIPQNLYLKKKFNVVFRRPLQHKLIRLQ